jgi:hypothetical protein
MRVPGLSGVSSVVDRVVRLAWLALLATASGCVAPSRVSWSPDGSHGVYQPHGGAGETVLIGDGGHVLAQLAGATGDVGWSADSSTAYFGVGDDRGGPRPAVIRHAWLGGGDDEVPGPSTADAAAVCRWRAGKVDRLVAIPHASIAAVEPSPDGRWLVIAAGPGTSIWSAVLSMTSSSAAPNTGGAGLYAYALGSGRLYRIAFGPVDHAWAGPDRLAMVESTGPDVGQIVEQTLDEAAAAPARRPRVAVLPDATSAPQPAAGGLVFRTVVATFPAPPAGDSTPVTAIFRVRPDGRIDRLADTDGGTLAVSPDGRRVLFSQRSPHPGGKETSELAVMDADGSHRHGVMDLAGIGGSSLIAPAWHGSDRVTFASAEGRTVKAADGQSERTVYDVVDYVVPRDGPMRPVATLSQDWPTDLKPSSSEHELTTRPTVQSPR